MANMELITSVTVGAGGAASVTLPATGTIPQTYTDLKIVMSARTNRANVADGYLIKPNNTSPTVRYITGDGSTAYSGTDYSGIFPAANATASTFGNSVAYFPNYANTSYNKSFSVDDVSENSATTAYATLSANLYSSTSAITTIVIQSINSANIVEGSTFYLYGISNVTSTTKATGGIVSSDGTYNYHTFPFSSTFTPTVNLTADYLVIAGGGAGGRGNSDEGGGGGGAGGLRSTITATGGGGTIESAVSLSSGTAYTITVGAGGTGVSGGAGGAGNNGSNSSIAGAGLTTVTSTGGGGGRGAASENAGNGGSGGGGGSGTGSETAGTGITGSQGFGGGAGIASPARAAGGGGGAGAIGTAGNTSIGGAGGVGVYIPIVAGATDTSFNGGYYAGGGGGGTGYGVVAGVGGLGGGGAGSPVVGAVGIGVAGVANTGGGGGGSTGVASSSPGGAGGSGLVIIRYAI